jgi:acetoacetyl-CoA synthetase
MHRFLRRVSDKFGIEPEWEELRCWAIEQREAFWNEMLEFAEIEPGTPAECVVDGDEIMSARWFPGMTLNYARHLLRFDDDEAAVIFERETGQTRVYTHRALRDVTARFAAALKAEGVGTGDRVAAFMPNIPETIIAMLAAASIGATWSSCSPDFGVGGVLDRFGQIEPSVLVTIDGYTYAGKPFDTMGRVADIAGHLPSLKRVVVVPFLNEQPDLQRLDVGVSWDAFVGDVSAQPLSFMDVPFDHPLFIMYSSGTTGVPKCIVHGHGGTLLQHVKEHMLHCDVHHGDRVFYYTTCGWMMWNWLVSALGSGAAVVLYEGNPFHPEPSRLWDFAERVGITLFGTSPKYVGACQKAHLEPGKAHDLSKLRTICSTGSPLTVEQFQWVYEHVKRDVQLSSISGGTDIISCFMLGNPLLPVCAGEIQCRGLGMDVHALNDAGEPVIGEKGELVCASPFPSRPVCFWNDPEGAKYRSAYFERFPDVWTHGDFIQIQPNGGIIVYGRSDATLNPGGVRIGTAEIYRIVESVSEVVDSIVVGKRTADDDVDIALFLVLRPGVTLSGDLEKRIRQQIAEGATRRHVPKYIRQVTAIPYTISGKKVELAVTQMIHGEDVANRDALANPAALDEYAGIL